MQRRSLIVLTGLIVSTVAFAAGDVEPGFTSLFDGKTLNGWKLLAKSGEGYLVQGGMIVCPPKGGGNLFYDKEFSDFVLRFEFQLEDGSNNGLAIRAPNVFQPSVARWISGRICDDLVLYCWLAN
jgi:hypothetical protein